MRTLAAACALLAATAVPASATASSPMYAGGCGYTITGEPTEATGEGFGVVVDAQFLVYDATAPATPVGATVTCELFHVQPDGEVRVHPFTFSGTSVVAGAGVVRVPADSTPKDFWVCLSITYHADSSTTRFCYDRTLQQFPPQEVADVVEGAVALVPGGHDTVCAATPYAAPLAPAPFINSEGDVFYGDYVFDC